MKKRLLLCALFLGHGLGQSQTQELQAGIIYSAGTRVSSSQMGISVQIPQHWQGAVQSGSVFAVASNSKAGLGLLIPQVGSSREDLVAFLERRHDLGQGIIAIPQGRAKQQGNQISQIYQAGQSLIQARSVLGQHNNGMTVFVLGLANQQREHQTLLNDLTSSLRFFAPQAASMVQQWNQNLRGKKVYLYEVKTTGGSNTTSSRSGTQSTREATWHLCSNGQYRSSRNFHASINIDFDTGSGYDKATTQQSSDSTQNTQDAGVWKVVMMGAIPVLSLRSSSGAWYGHGLWFDGQSMFVDKTKVAVSSSEICR
jgi:hypothetical protein